MNQVVSESRVLIAPSVLSADFGRLAEQVQVATEAGADLIHVDVMDGVFVPNISFGEVVVDAIRGATHLPLNIHLMVREPDALMATFLKSETDQILVHAEACQHLHRTVSNVKEQGNQVGVAINPGTPVAAVEEVLSILDIVMVMSVNPGFAGQSFIPESVDKIRRLRKVIDERGLAAARGGGRRSQGRLDGAGICEGRGDDPGSGQRDFQQQGIGSGGNAGYAGVPGGIDLAVEQLDELFSGQTCFSEFFQECAYPYFAVIRDIDTMPFTRLGKNHMAAPLSYETPSGPFKRSHGFAAGNDWEWRHITPEPALARQLRRVRASWAASVLPEIPKSPVPHRRLTPASLPLATEPATDYFP